MKTVLICLFFFIPTLLIHGQDEKEYRLNEYFDITTKKQYAYKRVIKKENGAWSCSDFDRKGRLVQLTHYTEENLRTKTGYSVFYEEGKKFYEGYYRNNRPSGVWYFYQPYGQLVDSLNYDYYRITKTARQKFDSLYAYKYAPVFDTVSNQKRDTTGIFTKVDNEAAFPGGLPAWKKYLEKNLIPKNGFPDHVYKNSGTVVVQFVVCTDGGICNVEPTASVHPLIDWAAVRTIRKGPYWEPAEHENRKVKAYHMQPVTFLFDME